MTHKHILQEGPNTFAEQGQQRSPVPEAWCDSMMLKLMPRTHRCVVTTAINGDSSNSTAAMCKPQENSTLPIGSCSRSIIVPRAVLYTLVSFSCAIA
eukprot:2831477-Amphidinium_carterae.1